CSNEPEETEEVVAAFGAAGFVAEGGAEYLPPLARRFVGKDGALRILPEAGEGLDGFFAAAWRRGG
ncbi:MAG: SAM-dependent methyltransferase, partial [Nitrospinota bacterium]|nr:SAM-dependent methyltransferase [Nitrospinota bacterium]